MKIAYITGSLKLSKDPFDNVVVRRVFCRLLDSVLLRL